MASYFFSMVLVRMLLRGPHAAKGTFNNYVDQLLAKLNHLSLSSGQLCTFYIINTLCSRDQAWNLYWIPTHLPLLVQVVIECPLTLTLRRAHTGENTRNFYTNQRIQQVYNRVSTPLKFLYHLIRFSDVFYSIHTDSKNRYTKFDGVWILINTFPFRQIFIVSLIVHWRCNALLVLNKWI